MKVHEAVEQLRSQIKVLDEKLAAYEKFGTVKELTAKLTTEVVSESKEEPVETVEVHAAFKPRAIRLMESFK